MLNYCNTSLRIDTLVYTSEHSTSNRSAPNNVLQTDMSFRNSILKESRKHNSPQSVKPKCAKATNAKHLLASPGPSTNSFVATSNNPPVFTSMATAAQCIDSPPELSTPLASSIRTLIHSLNDPGQHCISNHDLIEAYNVLSCRLRSQINDIFSSKPPQSLLTAFGQHSLCLTECLSRDIRRVLPNPFTSQSPLDHSFGLSFLSDSPNEEDLESAMDNATLCHYALRLVSDVFTFPALFSTFSSTSIQFQFQVRNCI